MVHLQTYKEMVVHLDLQYIEQKWPEKGALRNP